MIFILVMTLINSNGGGAISQIEFKTGSGFGNTPEERCIAAGEAWEKRMNSVSIDAKYICVKQY